MDPAISADHWVKLKENEKKDKYLYLARELAKLKNMKVTIIPIVMVLLAQSLGNNRTDGDYSNYHIIEIGQNTEKSPGDLRGLAITQNPVKYIQVTLMWKTQGVNNNNDNIYIYMCVCVCVCMCVCTYACACNS